MAELSIRLQAVGLTDGPLTKAQRGWITALREYGGRAEVISGPIGACHDATATNGADRTGRMACPMAMVLVGGGWLAKAPRRRPTSNPASVRREICVKREGAAC